MKSDLGKKHLWAIIALVIVLFSATLIFSFNRNASPEVSSDPTLSSFSKEQLRKYNGTDPSLPIYLALDGNVYDVTKGKEFYEAGGSYHYLAGKDSSFELHIVGGDIIKKKYPIIGRFENTH